MDLDEVFEEFVQCVQGLIPADRMVIAASSHYDQDSVPNLYISGLDVPNWTQGFRKDPGNSLSVTVLEARRSIIISQDDVRRLNPEAAGVGLLSALVVPLISKNESVGALYFRAMGVDVYTDHHIIIAESISAQIAGTIASAELYTQLKKSQKAQDRLTSMMNATTDLVAIANSNGKVIYMNEAGRDLLGITHNDQVLDIPIDMFHPSWANAVIQDEGIPDQRQLEKPVGLPHQRILPVLVVAPSNVACSGGGKVTSAKTSSPSHASSN